MWVDPATEQQSKMRQNLQNNNNCLDDLTQGFRPKVAFVTYDDKGISVNRRIRRSLAVL